MGLSGLVSDGAKALVKLALSGLGCPSLPDMFHLLPEQIHRQCNCPSTGATAKTRLRRNSRSHLLPPSLRCQPKSQYYKPNRTNWKSTVKTISKIYALSLTPDLNTGNLFGFELPTRLQSILANGAVGSNLCPTRAAAARCRQIPHLSGTIHAWWQWVLKQTQDPDTQHWVLTILLPWVWHQQTERHGTPNSNRDYKPLNKRTLVFWHIALTPRH